LREEGAQVDLVGTEANQSYNRIIITKTTLSLSERVVSIFSSIRQQ